MNRFYKFYLLIILVFLIPHNIYSNAYINDTEVNILDDDIYNDAVLVINVSIVGTGLSNRIFSYNKEYKSEGVQLIATNVEYISNNFDAADNKLDRYNISFTFLTESDFTGETELLPLEIYFVNQDNPKDIVATTIPKQSVNISSAYIRDIIIIIIFSILSAGIVVILALFGIKFYNQYQEKQELKKNENKNALAEIFYDRYQLGKVKEIKKDLKNISILIKKLLIAYILKKFNCKNLDSYYDLKDYDDSIKEEVKKFIIKLNKIGFSKDKVTKDDINCIEEDFKTLLFII